MDILNAIVALSNFVLIPAIAYGSQLALGALGVTLIYGILRFSNFAHGDTMAFGTMVTILVTWWFQSMGLGFGVLPTALLALPFGIAACMALVLVTDRMVYRFYREQKAKPVILVIVSIGVMFVLNGLVRFMADLREHRLEVSRDATSSSGERANQGVATETAREAVPASPGGAFIQSFLIPCDRLTTHPPDEGARSRFSAFLKRNSSPRVPSWDIP